MLTVLLVAVWIGSNWKSARSRDYTEHAAGFTSDGMYVGWGIMDFPETPYGFFLDRPVRLSHTLGSVHVDLAHGYGAVDAPLWFLAGLSCSVAVVGWRLDVVERRRRSRLDLCPACSYDRAGLAAGAVCPECGCTPP